MELKEIRIDHDLVTSHQTSLWLQLISAFWFGMATSNLWAITQSIAGPEAAATWTGLQNAFGNLAGFVGAWLTGWLVKVTGSFITAFGLAAGMAVMAAMMYFFVVGDVKPIKWTKASD